MEESAPLRISIENLPDFIFIKDTESRFITSNAAHRQHILRVSGQDEVVGKTDFDFYPWDQAAQYYADEQEVIRSGRPLVEQEKLIVDRSGEKTWLSTTKVPMRDADGKVTGLTGTSRDITRRKQAEEALRESEERYRAVVEQSADGIWLFDQDTKQVLESNTRFQEMLGYTAEELRRMTNYDFVAHDNEDIDNIVWRKAREGENSSPEERKYRRSDGTLLDVEVNGTLVSYRGKEVICSVVRDITGRKRIEGGLKESEERFRQLFEQSVDTMFVHDEEGRILDCNSEACRTLGYTREELLSLRVKDIANGLLPEDERREREKAGGTLWQRVVRGEQDTFGTIHYGEHKRKDGTTFPIEVRLGGVSYGGRRMILASARDITGRKRAETRLREIEARFRALFDQTTVGVCVADLDRRLIETNAAYQEITGYSGEELVGMSTLGLTHPDDRAGDTSVGRTSASGDSYRREKRYVRKDGEVIWASAVSTLVRDESGEPRFIIGIVEDVTERRRVDEELRASEERFHSAFDNTPIGMAIVDLEGRYLQVNRTMCEILGYSEEEFLDTTFQEITYPEDYEKSMAYAQRMLREGTERYSIEKRYVHAKGHPVWVFLSVSLVKDPESKSLYHVAQVQDITARKQAEEALRESEERYRSLVELSPDAIVAHSEGEVVYANAAGAELFGMSAPEELIGCKALDFVHPDCRETVKARIERVLEKGEPAPLLEETYIRLDGELLDVEVAGAPVHYLGKPAIQVVLRDITERKRSEEALRASEERYRTVVERTTDGIHIYDFHTKRILETNTALQNMLGYTAEELLGLRIYDLIAHSRETITRNGRRIIEEKSVFLGERRYRRKDGSLAVVETSATVIPYAGEEAVCTIVRDVTERKRVEEELRKSEARNKAILETTPDLIFIYDRNGEYLDIQANYPAKLYLPREELLGNNLWDVLPPEVAGPFLRKVVRTLDTGKMQTYEYRLNVPEGVLDFEARMVVSGPDEVLCAVRDITERKAMEERLEYQAFHDPLTGLPNRLLFMDRVQHALARIDRHGKPLAVLFLDLDNFKIVNDSLGHTAGDQLLAKVAHRLKTCLRPEDTVARLGGDEFVILLETPERLDGAILVAERVAETLQPPFVLNGHEVSTTASIGIVLGVSSRDTPDDLLRNADAAMYRVKEQSKAGYAVFDPSMSSQALERLKLESDLKRAIDREEFVVHYQPKIKLPTGEIVGMEALIRWRHPERGLVLPDEFIPLAEDLGLIIPIGNWVLENACRQARDWQEQYYDASSLTLCVNLSARQVQYPRLAQEVVRIIRETGVDPNNLNLEVTESVVMKEEETTFARLSELKQLGIELAIDDFGTGYSSLSYLKRLPVDVLKIDRSFVWGLGDTHADTMLVSAVIELAHALGLGTVAEGVETAEQLEQLRNLGCDMVQGNHLVQALTSEEMSALIQAGLPAY